MSDGGVDRNRADQHCRARGLGRRLTKDRRVEAIHTQPAELRGTGAIALTSAAEEKGNDLIGVDTRTSELGFAAARQSVLCQHGGLADHGWNGHAHLIREATFEKLLSFPEAS
jgi:hypothetical protein